MNVIQYEYIAFIFPDDMAAFRQRYGVDCLCVDLAEGVLMGIGPNDHDWREIPSDAPGGAKLVNLRKVD